MSDKTPWYKKLLPYLRSDIQTLDLKQAGGISFDTVSAGWYLRNGYPQIYSILTGGMPAWSGEAVSVETALNHSVVWACNRIISESIGFIPAVMYQKKDGVKREADKHPMYEAMKYQANDEITSQAFTEMLTSHCVMTGNAYAKIIRRSGTGTAIEFQPLVPQEVFPDRERQGQKRLVYVIKDGQSADKTYTVERGKPQDILHLRGLGWDGLRGYSVITMGRQSMGTAIAEERNVARFWANGGRVPYHLEMPQKFKTDEDFMRFRDHWEQTYAEPHRAPILEGGIQYKQDGLNMKDAQALETRLYTVAEICRWFCVSPHLVQDLSHSTFSNIEHLALDFVKMTLNAWMWRWEQEFRRCVLTPEEKAQGYYLRFNIRELLRGDFITRMQGYASALQNGHMSIDEVRDEEERNPLPNGAGSHYMVQLNMQALSDKPVEPAAPASESGAAKAQDRTKKRLRFFRRIA